MALAFLPVLFAMVFLQSQDVVVVELEILQQKRPPILLSFCTKVTMLVRRDEMRASKAMQKRVFNTPNIEVMFNHETKSINGEKGVESVTAYNNQTKEETIIPATGFFVAIGHKPNTDLFKGQLGYG